MLAKIHIVIPIEKQIMSALENRFLFVDRTSQTRDMEKNILTNFSVNTLSYLRVVVFVEVAYFRHCPSVVIVEP